MSSLASELPTPRLGLASVPMDRRRVVQAVENMVRNAIQHSNRGGEIRTEVVLDEYRGRRVAEWRVRDGGKGFREADLPHVFEPFFSRRRGGTGLGLSIVRRVAEDHGGEVVAANEPRGGALVILRLPLDRSLKPETGEYRRD
jgi:signal transduction histidine kinase